MATIKTFIYFSVFLFVLYIVQWWILFYQFPDLPEYISGTNIKVSGLVLALTVLPTLYYFLKAVSAKQQTLTTLQLTGWGVLLAVVTELVFQILRQIVANTSIDQKISEGSRAVGIAALIIGLFSFMLAFKLKHKNSIWNTVILFLFFGLVYFLKAYTSVLN